MLLFVPPPTPFIEYGERVFKANDKEVPLPHEMSGGQRYPPPVNAHHGAKKKKKKKCSPRGALETPRGLGQGGGTIFLKFEIRD